MVSDSESVRTITLSRPKARNAWTEKMRNELVDSIDAASRDPSVRVIILTGDPAGKVMTSRTQQHCTDARLDLRQAFCAGADLSGGGDKAFNTNLESSTPSGDIPLGRPVNNSTWRDGGGQAGLALVRCTKPNIAAINGHAVGVGITFPLCADIRVVSEEAKIGFVFTKRGLCMETLSSFYLPRVVGLAKVTGEAAQCQRHGTHRSALARVESGGCALTAARRRAFAHSPIG